MNQLHIGIHLPNKPQEFILLKAVDFERDVKHLKQLISICTQYDVEKMELIHSGQVLYDDKKLKDHLKSDDHVHCFERTSKYVEYVPSSDIRSRSSLRRASEMMSMMGNPQINLNSRVNILQKVLNEYPQLRRDLAALIMLRDTVLFHKLHRPEVLAKLAEHHPILVEASGFISATVRKELAAQSSNSGFDPNNDSTNSSDEESLSDRRDDSAGPTSSSAAAAAGNANRQRSDRMQLRQISRQQLQAALAEIDFGSVNSLSNIAQQNTDQAVAQEENRSNAASTSAGGSSTGITNSLSDERLSHSALRSQLQRALAALDQATNSSSMVMSAGATPSETGEPSSAPASVTDLTVAPASIQTPDLGPPSMETDAANTDSAQDVAMTDDDNLLPAHYRSHAFANQLLTMAQMGFINYEVNITFLNMSNGNVENAINLLMAAIA